MITERCVTGLLLWLAAGMSLLMPAHASAQTHMGQPPENHVSLVGVINPASGCGNSSMALYRQRPDGNRASAPFVVPGSQYLMLTDLSWVAADDSSIFFERGYIQVSMLGLKNNEPIVGIWEGSPVPVLRSNISRGGGKEIFPSGVRMAPNRVYCVRTTKINSASVTGLRTAFVFANGYVIDKN